MSTQEVHEYRTHTCGELREDQIGEEAKLSGWVHNIRDHGGVCFIDLRDHYGITQVVIHPESDIFQQARHDLHYEYVVRFTGQVVRRDDDTVNDKIPTGMVELHATDLTVLGKAGELPFPIHCDYACPESTRLKYRFLDLRRKELHDNIMLRSQIISSIRRRMTDEGFNEIQTPILTASSPEGARDYLVPSRLHPGQFYALPQAPQQFKQLLMVAGFDRYFQIAPCFRDEDARADRSPGEFYQLDMELSFATQDDVFAVVETVVGGIFKEFSKGREVCDAPFVRIPYKEAIETYGCDKPDLRNPLKMIDVSDAFRGSNFKAFAGVIERGGAVKAIVAKNCIERPRKFYEEMITFAQSVGSKGLGYIGWPNDAVSSPIPKFIGEERLDMLKKIGNVEDGDVMFFIADKVEKARNIASHVIAELGKRLDLIEKNAFRFCWIVDYPMYEKDEQTGKIEFSHNPFSMPQGGKEALENEDPLNLLAWQYDLVCNGIELSSGALRNHDPDVMYKAFEIGGYTKEEVDKNFGGMINAFTTGAPPHGGIAPGIDRMVMLLADVPNIREVIAFPFNQQAQDLMMGAPSAVDPEQLDELHLRIVRPK